MSTNTTIPDCDGVFKCIDWIDILITYKIPIFLGVIGLFLALFWLICHFMVKYCQARTLAQHNTIYDTAGGVERSQSFRHYQPRQSRGSHSNHESVEMQRLNWDKEFTLTLRSIFMQFFLLSCFYYTICKYNRFLYFFFHNAFHD